MIVKKIRIHYYGHGVVIHYSAKDQNRGIKFGSKYALMDFYKTQRLRFKGAWIRVT